MTGAIRLLLVVGRRMAARLTSSDFLVVHGRNADYLSHLSLSPSPAATICHFLSFLQFVISPSLLSGCIGKNKVMQPRFEYKCGFLNCDVALILQR
nr:hypothetical protein Iba_chr09eCG10460 [Ipomoea batatas]